jgi:hypothetical protein
VTLDAFEIARAAVQQKKSGFLAVSASGNFARINRLMHDHAQIPIHAEGADAENILSASYGEVRHGENFVGVFDAAVAGDKLRRLPAMSIGHFRSPSCSRCTKRSESVSTVYEYVWGLASGVRFKTLDTKRQTARGAGQRRAKPDKEMLIEE